MDKVDNAASEGKVSWEKVRGKYKLRGAIGKGSFGLVAKAINRKTNKKVAIKRMEVLIDE